MLEIIVPASEFYDERTNEFVYYGECKLCLEHSLKSLSDWESKWKKVFISKDPKTEEETIDYIKCMTLNDVSDDVYTRLSRKNIDAINEYIQDPRSATFVTEKKGGPINREPITSELIYYWMVAFNIPFSCETWNLNRLITLVKVCNLKQQTPKKQSAKSIMSRNSALNAARRAQLNTTG